jgi:hypothetical protein
MVVALTDGIADDLDLHRDGPAGFVQEIGRALLAAEQPAAALRDLIGYELRGSFDDRTAVVLLRRG